MNINTFLQNRQTYGACSSWAVYDLANLNNSKKPMFRVEDLCFDPMVQTLMSLDNSTDQSTFDSLGLNPNVVLLGLNFAQRDDHVGEVIKAHDLRYHSFHELRIPKSSPKDKKLAHLVNQIPSLRGAYLTDFVKFDWNEELKPYINTQSNQVAQILDRYKDFAHIQINGLIRELKSIGSTDPLIVCMGADVYNQFTDFHYVSRLNSTIARHKSASKVKLVQNNQAKLDFVLGRISHVHQRFKNAFGENTRFVHIKHFSQYALTTQAWIDETKQTLFQ